MHQNTQVAIILRYEMVAEWTRWPWMQRWGKINLGCKVYRTEDGVGVVDEVEKRVQNDLKGKLFIQCTLVLQLIFQPYKSFSILQILEFEYWSNIG